MEAKSAAADPSDYFDKWEWVPTGLLLIVMGVLLLLEVTAGINIATRINVAVGGSPKWLSVPSALLAMFLGPLGAFLGWKQGRIKGQSVPCSLQSAAGGASSRSAGRSVFVCPFLGLIRAAEGAPDHRLGGAYRLWPTARVGHPSPP